MIWLWTQLGVPTTNLLACASGGGKAGDYGGSDDGCPTLTEALAEVRRIGTPVRWSGTNNEVFERAAVCGERLVGAVGLALVSDNGYPRR